MTSSRRVAASAAAGAAGAALSRYVRGRRRLMEEVDPQLRSPVLYLPMHAMPGGLFARGARLIANRDYIRPVERDVDVEVLTAASPDDGHEFSARKLTPRRGQSGARQPGSEQSSSKLRPAMLWTHGGGHLFGGPGFYDPQNSRVADELGALVISPSYRKASAAPFPADFDDCFAALRWLQDNAEELGVDPGRIAVCGDSAGGGLAAGLVQRSHDEGRPVAFQGLVYPMLDHRTTDKADSAGQFIWTAGPNRRAWATYLGADHYQRAEAGTLAPYASPAWRPDFFGLPPTWIGVGRLDLFYEESRTYADHLAAAGVPVAFDEYPGAYHGFDHIAPHAAVSRRLIDDMIVAMRLWLAHGDDGGKLNPR